MRLRCGLHQISNEWSGSSYEWSLWAARWPEDHSSALEPKQMIAQDARL